jgi:hypothetical protein
MNDTNFILKDFDLDNLSGQARTTCDSSSNATSEPEAIRQACRSQSQQMPEGYKVDYDGCEFSTVKRQNASGKKVTDITFGFELKSDD